MANLQGKVAVITGASKGIGASIARELAGRGAAVAVNYAGSKAAADKLVAEIKAAGGKAVAIQADLSNPDSIGPFIEKAARELGPIDILVNNAGIYEFNPIESVTPEQLPQAVQCQRAGLVADHAGGSQALQPGGRQHHQHRLGGCERRGCGLGLQRNKRSSGLDYRRHWPRNWGPERFA